jgi:hypothetical protein
MAIKEKEINIAMPVTKPDIKSRGRLFFLIPKAKITDEEINKRGYKH